MSLYDKGLKLNTAIHYLEKLHCIIVALLPRPIKFESFPGILFVLSKVCMPIPLL